MRSSVRELIDTTFDRSWLDGLTRTILQVDGVVALRMLRTRLVASAEGIAGVRERIETEYGAEAQIDA